MIDGGMEQLKTQLRQLRTENKLVAVAFLVAFVVTYTLLPAAIQATRLSTPLMLKLEALCFFMGGAVIAVLLTSVSRARAYRALRRSETIRMQGQFLLSPGKDTTT